MTFVIARDPARTSASPRCPRTPPAGLLREAGVRQPIPDTVVLVEEGRPTSDPMRRSGSPARLSFPWPLAYGFIVVPRFIRDRVYDVIAARRYRWFGRRDVCMVPTPGLRSRFLDS